MAYPVEITLGMGNKVSLNYQSHEVNVAITYQLEREDTNVLVVAQEKTRELVAAHALAWKQVKQGLRPGVADQAKEVETGIGESDAPEEPHVLKSEATEAQIQLIYSMGQQAGVSEDELERRIHAVYGCTLPEELNHTQAVKILVDLSHEGRERFDQERTRSLRGSEHTEEKPIANSP